MADKPAALSITELKLTERTVRGLRSVGATTVQDCINLLAGIYTLPTPERFYSPGLRRNDGLSLIDRIKQFGPQGKNELIQALRDLGLDMSRFTFVCHGCGGSIPMKSQRKHLKSYCNACHRVVLCHPDTQKLIQVALDLCHEKDLFKRFAHMPSDLIAGVSAAQLNKEE